MKQAKKYRHNTSNRRYLDFGKARCRGIVTTLLCRYTAALALFLAPQNCIHAQKSKGDKCFNAYEYHDAIKYYKTAVSSNPSDTASLVRLAECYQIIRDYANAEIYFAKAASMPGTGARVLYRYGEILKNNGKIDEARTEFLKATILDPADSNAAREVRYCNMLKRKFYIDYPVKPVNAVNSEHSDFSPAAYGDDLVSFPTATPILSTWHTAAPQAATFTRYTLHIPAQTALASQSLFRSPIIKL
ncbi:MAG: tetratricopeptide repeat protein [Bacteroidia bacterium]|nr:tetratricopeptide repeat protein [Bacteroidia bacterium]